MLNLEIPESDIVSFQKIMTWTEDEFERVLEVVANLSLKPNLDADLFENIKQLFVEDVEAFTQFIFRLVFNLTIIEKDAEAVMNLIGGLYEAVIEDNSTDMAIDVFVDRITKLFHSAVSIRDYYKTVEVKENCPNLVNEINLSLNITYKNIDLSNELKEIFEPEDLSHLFDTSFFNPISES